LYADSHIYRLYRKIYIADLKSFDKGKAQGVDTNSKGAVRLSEQVKSRDIEVANLDGTESDCGRNDVKKFVKYLKRICSEL
jgi:hypothetical protein